MIDKHLIERKLRKIEGFLKELKTIEITNLKEFKKDIVRKRFIERNLELAIEQMVDICKHFISGLDLKEPESYSECFEILTEAKILSRGNLDIFKSMVKFRNILIHAYDGIEDSITYKVYTKHLKDFKTFIKSIRAYLRKRTKSLK